jgi:hypothetical protein
MWTKRKQRTGALSRTHVLDVSCVHNRLGRRDSALVSSIVIISLWNIAGLFILWQGLRLALDLIVYDNHAFSIRAISIRTNGDIPVAEIRQWAGVRLGENLLALDLSRVRRDLELVPWIQEAAVERVLPDSLRLSITEREPISQAYATPAFRSLRNVLAAYLPAHPERLDAPYLQLDTPAAEWFSTP